MSEELNPQIQPQGSAIPRADKDAEGAGRAKGKRRRKVSYLTRNKIDKVDYKDIAILRQFVNDRYKILPARQTGCTAKQQRMVAEQINRAREMALMPFLAQETGADKKEVMGARRPRREERSEQQND